MPRFTSSIAIACTLLAACSKPSDNREGAQVNDMRAAAPRTAREAAVSGGMAPPGISPHAAPGVAFNYAYSFVLPSKAISAVQEQHAAACEKLGIARCRITGMRYSLSGEDSVSALLTFKLDPALARAFGKEGIAAVENAKGKLVDAAITGEDVGTQITASQRRSADAQAELSRIEARLAAGGIADRERAELTAQAARLRELLAGERDTRSAGEEQLADTPMTYDYTGDESFTLGGNPVGDAAQGAWDSLITMIAFVLMAIGVALPWLALLAVVLMLWRSSAGLWLRSKLRGRPAAVKEPVPAQPGSG